MVALHAKLGLPSIYGPATMPQIGEAGGAHAYTRDALRRAIAPHAIGALRAGTEIIEERLRWETERIRPRNTDKQRPGFERVKMLAHRGKVNAVIVFALDRIGRSMADTLNTVLELDWLEVEGDGDGDGHGRWCELASEAASRAATNRNLEALLDTPAFEWME